MSETPTHLDITRKDGTVLRVFFDAADYPLISQYRWHAVKCRNTFYAQAHVRKADGKYTTIYMHQLLVPDVPEVDHLCGNGLINFRSNLRLATCSQNLRNQRKRANATTSKFKGVCFVKSRNKYCARIWHNGKQLFLGYFATEEEAARAYDEAALRYFGEFSRLNFPKLVVGAAA